MKKIIYAFIFICIYLYIAYISIYIIYFFLIHKTNLLTVEEKSSGWELDPLDFGSNIYNPWDPVIQQTFLICRFLICNIDQ